MSSVASPSEATTSMNSQLPYMLQAMESSLEDHKTKAISSVAAGVQSPPSVHSNATEMATMATASSPATNRESTNSRIPILASRPVSSSLNRFYRVGAALSGLWESATTDNEERHIARVENDLSVISGRYNLLKHDDRKLRDSVAALTQGNKELAAERNNLLRRHTKDEQIINSVIAERDQLQAANHEALRLQQAERAENSKLHEEVRKYKQVLASATRVENQVADDEIRAIMDQLYNSMQDFAVNISRTTKFEFSGLPEYIKDWTAVFIPNAATLPSSHKAYIVVGLIAQEVLHGYALFCFFGLPQSHHGVVVHATEVAAGLQGNKMLKQCGWLDSTRRMLVASYPAEMEAADQNANQRMLVAICQILSAVSSINWTATVQKNLERLVKKVADLFMLLHRQKASYIFQMQPVAGETGAHVFSEETMTAVASSEEEGELQNRAIEMCVFPALIKHGDESGENDHLTTIISKARVIPQKMSSSTRDFGGGHR